MPPVMVTLSPPAKAAERHEEQFDPATFQPELITDVDAAAGPHKCNCAASDDNPY